MSIINAYIKTTSITFFYLKKIREKKVGWY